MENDFNQFKVTLFFPLYDNEGIVFGEDVWNWWKGELTRLKCGVTNLGVVSGWWQGYTDLNYWIVMVVKAREEVGHIRDFLREARKRFKQHTMYLDFHPVSFEEVR